MREERGAATLLVLACAGVLLFVGLALTEVSGLVLAHRSAQSAADLAALAAAAAAGEGHDACGAAAAIAAANGASLVSCAAVGFAVTVTVRVAGPALAGWHADLTGEARAGPER